MNVKTHWRWIMSGVIAILTLAVPFVYYRMSYTYAKRLRPIVEGRVYRSGCLTADGFRAAVEKYKFKTIVNFKDEAPDPVITQSYFDLRTMKESELCKQLGVSFRYIFVDTVYPLAFPNKLPDALDEYYKIMDDPANYPVLIHCQAGLHRTGVMAAVYRMEYQGWTPREAITELKNHGFGEFYSSADNPYIEQYVLAYKTRQERAKLQPDSHSLPGILTSRTNQAATHEASGVTVP